VQNPPNPWAKSHVEWLDEPPSATLEVFEEEARSMLSPNDSPDLAFDHSVNPYRGCLHACAYCYARPTHEWLGFGAGTDFERKIVVKTNAPDRLDHDLARLREPPSLLMFSGNTDCYQGLEGSYGLTRRCLEVCLRHRVAVAVVTKSALVARDVDLLAELARGSGAEVFLSVAFARDAHARAIEPWASSTTRRLEAMARLAEAGVPVGVSVAPVVPGLNESDVPEVLERARVAGATLASMTLLRLPGPVESVFFDRIAESFPDRVERVRRAIDELRAGDRGSERRFGERFRGSGPRWQVLEQLFLREAKRHGYEVRRLAETTRAAARATREAAATPVAPPVATPATKPSPKQLPLFGEPAPANAPRRSPR
jgi:DNA repair photolyase